MEENKFKSHAEKEFWEKVYVVAVALSGSNAAQEQADQAVAARRYRMLGLTKTGVKAA